MAGNDKGPEYDGEEIKIDGLVEEPDWQAQAAARRRASREARKRRFGTFSGETMTASPETMAAQTFKETAPAEVSAEVRDGAGRLVKISITAPASEYPTDGLIIHDLAAAAAGDLWQGDSSNGVGIPGISPEDPLPSPAENTNVEAIEAEPITLVNLLRDHNIQSLLSPVALNEEYRLLDVTNLFANAPDFAGSLVREHSCFFPNKLPNDLSDKQPQNLFIIVYAADLKTLKSKLLDGVMNPDDHLKIVEYPYLYAAPGAGLQFISDANFTPPSLSSDQLQPDKQAQSALQSEIAPQYPPLGEYFYLRIPKSDLVQSAQFKAHLWEVIRYQVSRHGIKMLPTPDSFTFIAHIDGVEGAVLLDIANKLYQGARARIMKGAVFGKTRLSLDQEKNYQFSGLANLDQLQNLSSQAKARIIDVNQSGGRLFIAADSLDPRTLIGRIGNSDSTRQARLAVRSSTHNFSIAAKSIPLGRTPLDDWYALAPNTLVPDIRLVDSGPDCLIGYEDEFASLQKFISEHNQQRLLLLQAEGGLGKSHLLHTLLKAPKTNESVLPLVSTLNYGARRIPQAAALKIFEDLFQSILANVPEMQSEVSKGLPTTPTDLNSLATYISFCAKHLAQVKSRKLLIIIDDFHYVDFQSDQLVCSFLAELGKSPHIKVILSTRGGAYTSQRQNLLFDQIGRMQFPAEGGQDVSGLGKVGLSGLNFATNSSLTHQYLEAAICRFLPKGSQYTLDQESVAFAGEIAQNNPYYLTIISQEIVTATSQARLQPTAIRPIIIKDDGSRKSLHVTVDFQKRLKTKLNDEQGITTFLNERVELLDPLPKAILTVVALLHGNITPHHVQDSAPVIARHTGIPEEEINAESINRALENLCGYHFLRIQSGQIGTFEPSHDRVLEFLRSRTISGEFRRELAELFLSNYRLGEITSNPSARLDLMATVAENNFHSRNGFWKQYLQEFTLYVDQKTIDYRSKLEMALLVLEGMNFSKDDSTITICYHALLAGEEMSFAATYDPESNIETPENYLPSLEALIVLALKVVAESATYLSRRPQTIAALEHLRSIEATRPDLITADTPLKCDRLEFESLYKHETGQMVDKKRSETLLIKLEGQQENVPDFLIFTLRDLFRTKRSPEERQADVLRIEGEMQQAYAAVDLDKKTPDAVRSLVETPEQAVEYLRVYCRLLEKCAKQSNIDDDLMLTPEGTQHTRESLGDMQSILSDLMTILDKDCKPKEYDSMVLKLFRGIANKKYLIDAKDRRGRMAFIRPSLLPPHTNMSILDQLAKVTAQLGNRDAAIALYQRAWQVAERNEIYDYATSIAKKIGDLRVVAALSFYVAGDFSNATAELETAIQTYSEQGLEFTKALDAGSDREFFLLAQRLRAISLLFEFNGKNSSSASPVKYAQRALADLKHIVNHPFLKNTFEDDKGVHGYLLLSCLPPILDHLGLGDIALDDLKKSGINIKHPIFTQETLEAGQKYGKSLDNDPYGQRDIRLESLEKLRGVLAS